MGASVQGPIRTYQDLIDCACPGERIVVEVFDDPCVGVMIVRGASEGTRERIEARRPAAIQIRYEPLEPPG